MTDANGMVWLTGDGGTTWLPFNVRTNPRLVSIYFADKFTGWAVGEDGLIVRTDDGGYSWQRLSEGGREDVNDLVFFDSEHRRRGRLERADLDHERRRQAIGCRSFRTHRQT